METEIKGKISSYYRPDFFTTDENTAKILLMNTMRQLRVKPIGSL